MKSSYAQALRDATADHYRDPLLYDYEYRRRRADVTFYRRLAAERSPSGSPLAVLELGCGTGRLLVPLLRDGHRVVGVDLSASMLDRCAARVAALKPAVRARAELIRADFRRLALGRRFPLILCPFNAMMHLYHRNDLEHFFAGVRAHLGRGGQFVFDVLNPDLDWLRRDPNRRWARTRFRHPRTGELLYYTTNHTYDAANQIAWIRIYYDPVESSTTRAEVVHLAHRQFFPEELRELLAWQGFRLDHRDGGFHGEPFEDGSESQVCRCSIAG